MDYAVPSTQRQLSARHESIALFLLLLLVTIIAWPGMSAPLLLDDLDQLAHVSRFKSWKECFGGDSFGLFRPAKNLIYYHLGNISLFPWHLLNFSAYLGAVVAVYFLLRRLLGSPWWALGAVTLWATCPTQTSTAIWMSCVNISLSMMFASLCLVAYDRIRERSEKSIGLMIGCCISLFLAECAYETAVSVPILCVLVDLLRKRRIFSKEAIIRYGIIAVVTLVFLLVRSGLGAVASVKKANLGFSPDIQPWQLMASAPWFLWRHLSMWLMPAGRIEFCSTYIWGYSATPLELAGAWMGLFVILGVIVASARRHPWIAFGLLWFLATAFPSSNFLPTWAGPIEDYYLVFPGVGLAIALLGVVRLVMGWSLQAKADHHGRRRVYGMAVLSVLGLWRVLCIPLFWFQSTLWQEPLTLYLNCELSRDAQFQLQGLAAREFLVRGDLENAREMASKSYEKGPWYPCGSMILGCVALESNELAKAEGYFLESMNISTLDSPLHDFCRIKLARTYLIQDEKRPLVKEILLPLLNNTGNPQHLKAIALQVDSYVKDRKPADALRVARFAVKLHPGDATLLAMLNDLEARFPSMKAGETAPAQSN